jgi:NADH:ubiquinone oxidoreductase subunit E
MDEKKKVGAVLVVGGGIAGMQASLDLAESGFKVYLVEKDSAIGGRMVQLDKTFPTNECAMCVVSPKLVDCARHPNIEIITQAEIEKIEGEPGNFSITLNKRPRYVNENKCTGCGACALNCPVNNEIYLIPEAEKVKIKLTGEITSTINCIIQEHRNKDGMLMLVLQSINAVFRYFPEDVLRYVSQELEIPLSQILRIATFYNAFSLKPKGKHVISVCRGTTCYVRGSDRILGKLNEALGIQVDETTQDSMFTLKSVRCLGCCSIAPAIMIDEKVYGHLNQKEIPKILKEYK